MNNGALHFNALLTTRDFETGIRRLENQIRGISNTTQQETSKIDGYFKNLSTGIGAYFSANMLQGFVQELVNVRGEFQKTEIAFGTMLQSKEKAKELMGQMVDLAAKTPFSLKDVSDGAKQLLAFQVPANEVVETLRRMGDVASALGVPISRINLVYGQVRAKGRLMGDDLRQFTEAGIPMIAELAKQFNKTTAEITDMVSAGKIGFTDVQKVLFNLTNEGGLFYNMMEQQAQSLSGKTERLKDAWEQMLNKIGESNEGILYSGIEGLTTLVENYEEVIKVLTILVTTYGAYKAALITTSAMQRINATTTAISTWLSLARSIRTAKDAQALFNLTASANPYGAILAVLGLLITSYIAYGDEIKEVIGLTEKANAEMRLQEQIDQKLTDTFSKGVAEKRSKIQELIFVLDNENTTLEERKQAYEQLIKIDASFIGTLDNQYRYTMRLGEAFDEVVKKMQNFALEQAKLAAVKDIIEKNAQDELNFSITKTKVKQIDPNFNKKAKEQGFDVEKNPSLYYDAVWSLSYHGKITNDQREKLLDLTKTYKDYGNAVKESREELVVANKVQKDALYQYNKEYNEILAREKNGWKTAEGKKYTDKFIAQMLQRKQELERLNSSFSATNENTTPTPLDSTKEDKKPKPKKVPSQKDTAIAGSLGAYEAELSKVQETLKNKTLATDKERVKALLEQEKELQEKIKEIKEQYAQRTFDEELVEIQRQVNLRDKYLQAGYSKESMDNLFPKVKDKTYLGYLNDTRDSLKKLLDTGKGNQETAQQLDRVNTAIDEFTAKKSYIEGLQQTIENLSTKFSGQELIDKLKKIKNLNANETEQESQEKNNLIDKTIEQEEQKMKQAYQRFLQEHKSFEERRLEITKQYDALRKQALEEANGDTNSPIYQKVILEIDKAESKDQTDLFFEEMQKSKEWVKVFEDMNMVATNKLEEFKRILKQKLTEAKTIEEKIKIGEFIKKIDDTLRSRNPFKALKDGIKALGDESLNALEKAQKLQNGISAAQSVLGDMKGIVSDVRGAFDDLGISTDNALGDFIDDVEQTIEGLNQMAEGVSSFVQGMATGNPVQMVAGAVKAVAGVIKAVSGWFNDDKKRERNIKRWAEALESVKEQYRALEHQMKKTLGEGVYKEQAGIIANLRKQQEYLQRMANEEAGKKKSDGGKIREWQNQIKEINRQIDDIMDNMINDIAKTDAKTLADQIGDALVDAFSRGEDAALAYEKTMDEVMKNAIKSALKQKLLAEPMKAIVDDMVAKMGYKFGSEAGDPEITEKIKSLEDKYKKKQIQLKYWTNSGKSDAHSKAYIGHLNAEAIQLKKNIEQLKQDFEDSKKTSFSGSFDGLTASEREEIKEKGKDAMNRYMEALKQYEDLFGSADANADSLKGAIKGMSEETAGVLAGQFNAIRMNTGELVKNSAFSLEAMKNAVGHLIKIEENTFNLHQMRKDLAELNSKVKGDKDFRANGF